MNALRKVLIQNFDSIKVGLIKMLATLLMIAKLKLIQW